MSRAVAEQHDAFLARFFAAHGSFQRGASRVVLALRSDGQTIKVRIRLSFIPPDRVAALIEPVANRGFVVVGDAQGRVMAAEGDVQEMLGFAPAHLVGKYASQFFRGNGAAMAVGDRLVTEIRGNEGQTVETEVERVAHAGPHWKCCFREVDFSLEVLITVRDGVVNSASLSCLNVLGFEPESLVGRSVLELMPRFSAEGERSKCRSFA